EWGSGIPTDAAAQETGSTAGAAQSPKAARQLADAKAAYDRKDFNGVIRLLKSVLEAEPQNLTAWRMRASAYFSKREFDNAIADLEHVLAVKPDDSTANAMMGDVWREKGDQDKALASFGRVIELDPKNSSALNNRGLLRIDRGELEGALADFNQALEVVPNNSTLLTNRGKTFERMGQLDRALSDYDRAILLDPSNKRAAGFKQFILAMRSRQGGRSSGASAPAAQPLLVQATRLASQRKYDEAIAVLDKAVAADAKSVTALKLRAGVRSLKRDHAG